jgi:Cu+-exporting ATPase
MTLAGAGSLATGCTKEQNKTVAYKIKGFSCITCAVGLDVMLRRNKGVLRSQSTYPEAITTVEFEPSFITGDTIKSLIAEMGFTAQEQPTASSPGKPTTNS